MENKVFASFATRCAFGAFSSSHAYADNRTHARQPQGGHTVNVSGGVGPLGLARTDRAGTPPVVRGLGQQSC